MRKFYFCVSTLLVLLLTQNAGAQLYVSNGYVYVADKYVYVKQDVNIQNTGNIYLRNESQFLQAKTGSSANSGPGKLSVFQEGSVNNFAYNYWCSPVGNSVTASGNESFGITMLNQPTSATASTAAIPLPNSSLNGIANPLSISQGWIFKFLSSSTYSQWVGVGSASTIAPGEGFTMKGTSGTDASYTDAGVTNNPGNKQRYDFRGRPNDGDVTINVGAGKRTLTGNPYPSAIDLKAFLGTATNTNGIAYFWEHDKTVNSHALAAYRGGYGTYSPLLGSNVAPYGNMGVYTPAVFYAYDAAGNPTGIVAGGANYERRFCPIGQGFMLLGTANGTVTMSNSFRVYQKEGAANYSQFERNPNGTNTAGDNNFLPAIPSVSGFDYTTVSTKPAPQIRFNTLMNNQAVRQTALVFSPQATDGADFAMDAKSPDTADMDMYFVIDHKEYVIDVVDFDINKRIPVGFKSATPATFKITVSDILNFDGADHVYLYDKQTDIYHDIKNSEYELPTQEGAINDRYEVTFLNGALGLPALDASAFEVLQNNASHTLTIANSNHMDIKEIALYDTTGKVLLSKKKAGNKSSFQVSTSEYSDAMYIVKITTTANQEYSKKIAVYNGK